MEPLWKAIVRLRPAVESSPKRAAHFCFGSKADVTLLNLISMSALPPKAEIRERVSDVRFGPKPDMLLSRKQVAYSARAPSLSTDAIGRTNRTLRRHLCRPTTR